MAKAAAHSTSRTTDDDAAIAIYLKDSGTGGSVPKPTPIAANDNAMRAGAVIYKHSRPACHRDAGSSEAQNFATFQ